MIALDATTKSLEIKLAGAVTTTQLPFVASWVDINQSTFALTASSEGDGASNNGTAVTAVAAPGATTTRKVNFLSVSNVDTAAATLTVQVNNNSTLRISWKGTLSVGDTLYYSDTHGFYVMDSLGNLKTATTTTGLVNLASGVTGVLLGVNGGTGVANTGSTITLGGSVTFSGAFATTITVTAGTSVTLPTSGTLVNSAVATLSSLASIGTITTGVWNGTVVGATYGGTGVNNGSSTITLGGALTFSGGFTTTITVTGNTTVTLPTTGTLVNTAVTTLSSLVSIGTVTTGTWNATIVTSAYGGTGNGFTKFSGPASSEKTFTLPNSSSTILTDNAVVTVAQGGSGAGTLTGILKGNGTSAFTAVTAPSGTIVGTTDTQTLTNKRTTARVTTISSSGTPTINTDNCDAVTITALAAAITSMTTNLSGTPVDFDRLMFRIKDNGTARAITWGASFLAKGVALPTTTVISKCLTVGFIWDAVASVWGCVASAQEA